MTTIEIARQMEAEDLAHAKDLVQMVLREWDWLTWNDLLADDVVLSIRLGAVGIKQIGEFVAVGGKVQVVGRDESKRVLKSIYSDFKRGLSVTTEIISGYDVALLGNLALPSTKENTEDLSLPIVLHMAFDYEGRVQKMTIAAVDLNPLIKAIRAAVQSDAAHA